MSDYCTLFCHKLVVNKREAVWLDRLIKMPPAEARKLLVDPFPYPMRADEPEDVLDFDLWPFFTYEYGLPEKQKTSVYFSSADSGSPYQVALVLRAFFSKFRPNSVDIICAANTCSSGEPDGYNGEEIVVTAHHIIPASQVTRMIYTTLQNKALRKSAHFMAKLPQHGITIAVETDT